VPLLAVITRTAESVFGALLYLTEKYGRVFPSLEGLAHLAMCCKQSVVTALADLERLGFITRIRRIRRIMTPLGFTTRQITNAYRVHEPARGLGLIASTLFATESNYWTPSASKFYSMRASDDSGPRAPETFLLSAGSLSHRATKFLGSGDNHVAFCNLLEESVPKHVPRNGAWDMRRPRR
jgi:hypothetical protein